MTASTRTATADQMTFRDMCETSIARLGEYSGVTPELLCYWGVARGLEWVTRAAAHDGREAGPRPL